MNPDSKLLFVYNAGSGLLNDVISVLHKTFSPKTYACNLCTLTFGTYYMQKPWKEFINSLDVDVEFLHRDDFAKRFGISDVPLPAAFEQHGAQVSVWIGADEMNQCESLDDLIGLVRQRLKASF